jgi:hypothetical protein
MAELKARRQKVHELGELIHETIADWQAGDVLDAIRYGIGETFSPGCRRRLFDDETLRLVRELHALLIRPADLDAAPVRIVLAARSLADAIPLFAYGASEEMIWPKVKEAREALLAALDELEDE